MANFSPLVRAARRSESVNFFVIAGMRLSVLRKLAGRSVRVTGVAHRLVIDRQSTCERRPFARRALDADRALVLLHDLLRSRQPDAGSAVALGAVEELEEMRHHR